MAQRSRKRGRHGSPTSTPAPPAPGPPASPGPAPPTEPAAGEGVAGDTRPGWSPPAHLPPPAESRSELKNAEVRATLTPFAPGERPLVVLVSALIAGALGLGNLIAWLAGGTIEGKHPAAGGIVVFTVVLLACAIGLWRMWYGAVLGWMALLAIIAILFTLFLIEASNVLGVIVALAIILFSGYLFFKLVRVLSRIQMPRPPGDTRSRQG